MYKMKVLILLLSMLLVSCTLHDERLYGYNSTWIMPEGYSEFINLSRPEEFSSIVDIISEYIKQEYNEEIVDITISDIGNIRAYTCGDHGAGKIYEISFVGKEIKSKHTKIWVVCG